MKHSVAFKSRRRLALLSVLSLSIIIMGSVVVGLHRWQLARYAHRMRQEAMQAIQRHDDLEAVAKLAIYLRHTPKDVPALIAYAQAQTRLGNRTRHAVQTAIAGLSRALALKPDRVDVADQLIHLQLDQHEDEDVVRIATRVLEQQPENLEIRRARAVALCRLKYDTQAIADVDLCIAHSPRDWDARIFRLFLMRHRNDPADKVQNLAHQWREAHPQEAAFAIIEGVASRLYGKNQNARRHFMTAITLPIREVCLVRLLVRQLEEVGANDAAMVVLNQGVQEFDDPTLLRDWAERLYQKKRWREISAIDAKHDPALHAMQILALTRLGRYTQARALLQTGVSVSTSLNAPGKAWKAFASVLVSGQHAPTPRALIDAAAAVLKVTGQNPILHDLIATQWAQLGESDMAIQCWRRAALEAPAWTGPRIRLAQLLLKRHQTAAAIHEARNALRIDGKNAEAAEILLQAMVCLGDPAAHAMALDLFETWQDQFSAASRLKLQARLEKVDQVTGFILQTMQKPSSLDADDLLTLAQISWQRRGIWHPLCLNQYRKRFGKTPDWALQQARLLVQKGQLADARRLFTDALAQQPGNVEWRLAQAQFLDQIADAAALEMWPELARQFPDNLKVQRAALKSDSPKLSHAMRLQIIGRIRQLTGMDAITWRLAQAKELLASTVTNQKLADAALLLHEAIRLAPDAPAPRMLLVHCLDLIGSHDAMREQLQAILNRYPDHPQARRRLHALNQLSVNTPSASPLRSR